MNRFRHTLVPLIVGVLGACRFAVARGSEAGLSPAELDTLLKAVQPTWTASASLEVGAGYKDNILLSRVEPASSPFARAGLEALAWRMPKGRIDYFGFFNGQFTRYSREVKDPRGRSVDHETEAFAGFEWRFKQPDWLTFTADAQGYYLDQVFDISDPSVTRVIEALRVHGVKAGPTVRVSPWRWLWAEATVMHERQRFDDGFNDARLRELGARMGVSLMDRIDLSARIGERRRAFERRPRTDGRSSLPGLLVVIEREREARLDTKLGRSRHWKTRTRAGERDYHDNAVGFLDYDQRHVGQEIEWAAGRSRVRVEVEQRRRVYRRQTVGAGIAPPLFRKKEISINVSAERTLTDRWTLVAEYGHERTSSNDPLVAYRANEGLLGVRWNWEK